MSAPAPDPSTPDRPAADAEALTYALAVTDGYRAQLAELGRAPRGLAVLELGPGADLGPALLLAGLGARVTVADRFLVRWSDGLAARYEALAEHVERERSDLSTDALRAVLTAGRHEAAVACHRTGIEKLVLPPGSVDVCLSNAVLEHVADLGRASVRLAQLTAPGGHGVHQVDFRDHRDFERPLEHLTDTGLARAWRHWRHRGALGSALRADDYGAAFEAAGFELLGFEPNLHAEDAYLEDVWPRLAPPFIACGRQALSVLSGRFVLRRREGARLR